MGPMGLTGPQGPQGPEGPAGPFTSGMIVSLADGVKPPAGWMLLGSNTQFMFLNRRLVKVVTNYYQVP